MEELKGWRGTKKEGELKGGHRNTKESFNGSARARQSSFVNLKHTRHLNTPDFFFFINICALFLDKLANRSHTVKESERKNHRSIPLSGSAPNVNGLYSGLRPILHPSVVKICSVISADKPTNKLQTINLQ